MGVQVGGAVDFLGGLRTSLVVAVLALLVAAAVGGLRPAWLPAAGLPSRTLG
ncbi:hypothetical protein [Nocardia kruczakiae]|uniref:hypothetical protein n=1 Tax=Nocardia kruczakiae TaxID=261477 RepID=UPI000AED96B1|nr:hypothetical protein [Nocardia kruczakiae]